MDCVRQLGVDELNHAITAIAGKVRDSILSIPLKDYIALVEWTGQSIVYPNKAVMPTSIVNESCQGAFRWVSSWTSRLPAKTNGVLRMRSTDLIS